MWDQNHIRMNISETNWIDDLKTSIKIKQNWAKFSLRVDQNGVGGWGVGGGASFIPQDPGPN
jgi:regulation of enolase protein 1 (concanavalin A-like superfamily)